MKIFILKKNKDGDTEFRLSKELVIILSICLGGIVTIMVGSSIFFVKKATEQSQAIKNLNEFYGD